MKSENIFRQIDIKQASLASINADIKDISAKLSGAEKVSLSYGIWLRFAAMILNAMLAHALFAGLRKKAYKREYFSLHKRTKNGTN